MLDFKEYSELILDGVRPSLIETAECAFRAIFESTPAAPARSNLKTIPWEELAGLYGVDTEDCKVDGALNKKKLSRKMQTIPAVRDMFDFVHRAINVAKEEADLDAYPALDSDPRFNTMVSNIRTDLLVNCLKTAASNPSGVEWWKSDEFAAKLGQEIAKKYMPISPEQLYKGNKSSNEPSYATSGEFSGMDGKVVSVASDPGNAEGHPAYVDGNGCVWYLTESGDYRCSIPTNIGHQRTVWTVYVTDGEINKITFDNSGDWDILVSSLGMFLAYGPELHLDPAAGNFFHDLHLPLRISIIEYLPLGIIVDLAANRPSLLKGFDVAQSDSYMFDDFRAFGFVTRLVAEGILDGDALRDIRSRLDKTQEINARIAIVADCISPASYGRLFRIYRDMCNSIQTGLNPLAASLSLISHFVIDFCSDDIIGVVTGESRDSRIRKQVFSDVSHYMRRIENDEPYNFYSHSELIHRYNSPGDAFFKKVFHSSNFNPDLAFNTVSKLSGLLGSEGMKNRKQLYADIRKHITPRVQRKLLAEDENRADELLDVLERTVPGFRYYTKGSRDIEQRMDYMDRKISPRDLLKLMLSFLSSSSSPTALLGKKIAVELMRPATIARLNADHPDYESRRIKDLLRKIYTRVNTTMGLLRGFDWGYDIDEPIAPFIENYFAPYVDQLQATLHTLSHMGYTGPALPKLLDWMLVNGSVYHLEKPDDASKLFLDEGGIFPSLHGEWWNEGILAVAITNRHISNFDLKAVSVSIAKEAELFSKLCAGIAYDTYDTDTTFTVLRGLVNLDKHWAEKTGNPLIPDADFANAMKSYPDVVLNLLPSIDKERSAQICEGIMTPEFMSGMVKTESGLKTLLTLTSQADWFNFTTQFIRANQMNIENTLRRMADSNQELVQKWTDYLSKINVDVGTRKAVRGTAASSVSETEIVYHEANGLQWMEKYLNDPSCGVVNPSSKVRLYTLAEVKEVLGHVADAGWRLPTVAELDHLGDNPDLIEEKQIGFTGTGHMVNGNYDNMANSLCYAWCAGEDGEPAGYSVMSNFIDTDDADIDPETDAMAIKLVR